MENYSLLRQVGKGAFGTVFLVKNKQDSKEYIVKQITYDTLRPSMKRYVDNEIKILQQIQHPYIVRYVDCFDYNECRHVVMEYCEKKDLKAHIASRKSGAVEHFLEEKQVICLFTQILLALNCIHATHKIIHRDIKPDNIFLTKDGVAKLGDFGVSRIQDFTEQFVKTEAGTPCYLSPEIILNKAYNNKTDIWSLGCVIHELLTLKPTFYAKTRAQINSNIKLAVYPPISSKYSTKLRNVVKAMLRKCPEHRPSAAKLLTHAITDEEIKFLQTESIPSMTSNNINVQPKKQRRQENMSESDETKQKDKKCVTPVPEASKTPRLDNQPNKNKTDKTVRQSKDKCSKKDKSNKRTRPENLLEPPTSFDFVRLSQHLDEANQKHLQADVAGLLKSLEEPMVTLTAVSESNAVKTTKNLSNAIKKTEIKDASLSKEEVATPVTKKQEQKPGQKPSQPPIQINKKSSTSNETDKVTADDQVVVDTQNEKIPDKNNTHKLEYLSELKKIQKKPKLNDSTKKDVSTPVTKNQDQKSDTTNKADEQNVVDTQKEKLADKNNVKPKQQWNNKNITKNLEYLAELPIQENSTLNDLTSTEKTLEPNNNLNFEKVASKFGNAKVIKNNQNDEMKLISLEEDASKKPKKTNSTENSEPKEFIQTGSLVKHLKSFFEKKLDSSCFAPPARNSYQPLEKNATCDIDNIDVDIDLTEGLPIENNEDEDIFIKADKLRHSLEDLLGKSLFIKAYDRAKEMLKDEDRLSTGDEVCEAEMFNILGIDKAEHYPTLIMLINYDDMCSCIR